MPLRTVYSPQDPFARLSSKASDRADMSDCFAYYTIAPAIGTGWVRYEWRGHELHYLNCAALEPIAVGVSFGELQPSLADIELAPGTSIRTKQEFNVVWLKLMAGEEGATYSFAVSRHPAVELFPPPIVRTALGQPLEVVGPLSGLMVRTAAYWPVEISASYVPLSIAGANPLASVYNETTAPPATTVLADTGALGGGDYEIDAEISTQETATGNATYLVHRNAANSADIRILAGRNPLYSLPFSLHIPRYTLAANERLLWRQGTAATATCIYWSTIRTRWVAESD